MGKQTLAVLGGRGMLGSDLAALCTKRDFDVRVYDLPEFDITNPGHLKEAVEAADTIVNCAAYTNVDGAESEAELAFRVNGEAVGRLGELARQGGKRVVHFSTDFVFDGRLDRPYTETDVANPISKYGESKLMGEQLLMASGCSCCVVRLEWTYGRHGRNFVSKLIERARADGSVRVVDDQVGAPTATCEVAGTVCELLEKGAEGLFNFAAAGYASRYEIAVFILDRLGLNVEAAPCQTSDFRAPAARPLNSRFDCSKIESLLSGPIAPWQEPLERFLRQL